MKCLRSWINVRFYSSSIAKPKKWRKPRVEGYLENDYFVDFKNVIVQAGNGGDGTISFARLWCNPFAGPDGADGGHGGHVIFQASASARSLSHLKSAYKAASGCYGSGKNMTGKSAEHTYIEVPVGTIFRRPNDEYSILAELNKPGDIFIAARGGSGGRGNAHFVSNGNRAPLCAEMGGTGEILQYDIELRVMAHAGLVGYPNAGKSTLLRAISRARPKVACYPFTTINPMVGIIEYDDFEQLSVADIPGLLPGLKDNYGLGTAFLKHIERCLCLFYVIDLSIENPWLQLDQLRSELESHREGLSKRPHAVVANKIDLSQAVTNLKEFERKTDLPIIPISAKNRVGLDKLLVEFRRLYDLHRTQWSTR